MAGAAMRPETCA